MPQLNPAQIKSLHDFFGYDVVIDADRNMAGVWCGDSFLYNVKLA